MPTIIIIILEENTPGTDEGGMKRRGSGKVFLKEDMTTELDCGERVRAFQPDGRSKVKEAWKSWMGKKKEKNGWICLKSEVQSHRRVAKDAFGNAIRM